MRTSPRSALGASIAQMGKLKPRAGRSRSQVFLDSFYGAEASGSPERTGLGQEGPIRTAQLWQLLSLLRDDQRPLARKLSSSLASALGVYVPGGWGEGVIASPAATASWALVTLATCLTPLILSVPMRPSIITIPVQK